MKRSLKYHRMTIDTKKKEYNQFKVTALLSAGEILCLKHALQRYESPLAVDILSDLTCAMNENEDLLKKIGND